MSDEAKAYESVNHLLQLLVSHLKSRDLGPIMSLFTADAILFGSEAQEIARGTLELHAFFERMLTQPMTISWTWRTLLVGQNGDTIWFVGPAALLVQDDTVGEQVYPYRLSGVLTRQPGREWLFSLFNGSEPAVR